MANLKNLHKIHALADGERVTVGNNRTIERSGSSYMCRLHGHPVFTLRAQASGQADVFLDACGYLTATTARAMQDFAGAFGVSLGVSRAGGVLSAMWQLDGEWCKRESAGGDVLSLVADRKELAQ
jgi:hypothetical protein